MESELWKVVESWNFWDRLPETGVEREIVDKIWKYLERPEAVYFYGPRRSGKTFVCYQILSKLSRKYGKDKCLYINFEEPSFAGKLKPELISSIVEQFENEFGHKPEYVFLDEVQNVEGWEKWVRTVIDKKELKVFVTGSSAKLLSSEFSTSLGGRGIGFFILPFSFNEFKKVYRSATLEDYIAAGGYPEVVIETDNDRRTRLLEEYFNTAIARDISSRYEVRDVPALRLLAVNMLTNSGKKFSYNKLRSMTGLSFDAIKQYLSYLEDAFMIFQVPHFSYSLKKAMEKPRKYYAYDLGMQQAISKSFSPDLGRKVENLVAIDLMRRGKEIQYYSNDFEVDFVVKEGLNITGINVCYSSKVPPREQKGLDEFQKKHKKAETLLIDQKSLPDWLSEE